MSSTARRTIESPQPVQPGQPGQPAKPEDPEPSLPGPRPPPTDLAVPGVLDPYIRKALERSVVGSGVAGSLWRFIAEKHPQVWADIGGGPLTGVALNPQPLPPRSAFLAAVVLEYTERMTLVCEMADLLPRAGGEDGHTAIAGHVARFIDEVCGNGFRLRWPFPWSAPVWFNPSLSAGDLVVMGTQFQQCAELALDADLGHMFADAAQALLAAAATRIV